MTNKMVLERIDNVNSIVFGKLEGIVDTLGLHTAFYPYRSSYIFQWYDPRAS